MLAAVLASSMGFIDSSVTAIALPAIRASLGGSLQAAAWVAGAYLLTPVLADPGRGGHG